VSLGFQFVVPSLASPGAVGFVHNVKERRQLNNFSQATPSLAGPRDFVFAGHLAFDDPLLQRRQVPKPM